MATLTQPAEPTSRPAADFIVIAHRGASAKRPEHTLAAYELAIRQGADFIEPDLVMTKDGVLVCRHENALAVVDPETGEVAEATTDVADRPEFTVRRATKTIDGHAVTGWFTEDFTLIELKTLRAVERLPGLRPGNVQYDGRFEVPTFAEVLSLAKENGVGVYPELKHPSYYRSSKLPMEEALLAALTGFDGRVFIQSFEPSCLRRLDAMTNHPLVQLVAADGAPADGTFDDYAAMTTPAGLREVAAYADGVGPDKNLVIPRNADGTLAEPTSLVADARAAGLLVHPWTFRPERPFLPIGLDLPAEVAAYRAAGVDGVFTDAPRMLLKP